MAYSRYAHHLVLALAFSLGAITTANAQSFSDRGKNKLPKFFVKAAEVAGHSTVEVRSDGRDLSYGTILSKDGYIITKGSEARGRLTCLLDDGTVYDAETVGYDRPTDLSLLKIDANNLTPINFASRSKAVVGNWVASVGSDDEPFAVGVTSVGYRDIEPQSIDGLIVNNNKGYMGIYPINPNKGSGVQIDSVKEDTAAEKAGLKAKDLILEIAGMKIKDRESLLDILDNYRPDDKVEVLVQRDGEEMMFEVTLGNAEKSRRDEQNTMGGAISGRRTGFPTILQHDTVLRPNQCGGPVVDLEGNVLGINIARAGRVETWAIPGDLVMKTFAKLKANQ